MQAHKEQGILEEECLSPKWPAMKSKSPRLQYRTAQKPPAKGIPARGCGYPFIEEAGQSPVHRAFKLRQSLE